MPGYEHLGPVIGTASTTSSNSLTVTLTDDAPATDPNTSRGLMLVIVSSEPSANAPVLIGDSVDGAKRYPTVSDSLGGAVNPNYLRPNGEWPFYPSAHAGQIGIGGSMLLAANRVVSGKTYLLRSTGVWILYNALSAGDTVTIDYSHLTTTLDWLACNIHVATNFPHPPNAYSRLATLFTVLRGASPGAEVGPPSDSYPTFRWCQVIGVGTISTIGASDIFTATGTDSGDGISFQTQYTLSNAGQQIGYGFQELDADLGVGGMVVTMPGSGTFQFVTCTGGDYWNSNFPTITDSLGRFPGIAYDVFPNPTVSLKRMVA